MCYTLYDFGNSSIKIGKQNKNGSFFSFVNVITNILDYNTVNHVNPTVVYTQ